MATLKGQTIAASYQDLVKRADSYSQPGTNIELMTDTDSTIAPTGLYLESGATTSNVGIGTAAPATLLEISGTAETIRITDSHDGWTDGDTIGALSFYSTDPHGIGAHEAAGIYAENDDTGIGLSGELVFKTSPYNTASTEVMRIDKAGNIGIGIDAPVNALHLYQDSSDVGSGAGITIEQDGVGDPQIQFLTTGVQRWVAGIDNSDSDSFKISSDGDLNTNARLTIDTSGNVGLGTSPTNAARLQLFGASALNNTLQLGNYGVTSGRIVSEGSLFITIDATDEDGTQGQSITFGEGGIDSQDSVMMTILQTGNVGINETSPAHKLDVDGGIVEQGGVLKENLLTNSGFDVWSNSTLENVGSDLVTNGTFADGGTWSLGTNVSITGGVGRFASVAAGQQMYQTLSITAGKLYKVTFTISSYSAGGVRVYLSSGSIQSTAFAANGTHTYVAKDDGDDNYLSFVADGTTTLDIDNVSVYEVTPKCGADLAPDGWINGTSTGLLTMRREHDGSNTKKGSFYALRANWTNPNSNYAIAQSLGAAGTLERFQGRTLTLGCWIKVEAGVNGYIRIDDGVGGTSSAVHATSTYTWVEVTHAVDEDATTLSVLLKHTGNDNPTTIYFSQPMLVFGSSIGEGNYTRPQGETIWLEYYERLDVTTDPIAADDKVLYLEALSDGKIPKGAKAVYLKSQMQDATITNNNGIYYSRDASGQHNSLNNFAHVAGVRSSQSGWVACDSNGDIYQTVTNSTGTLSNHYLDILGVELR